MYKKDVMETDKNQNQGKQSTARTDATYDRDAESLKNSSTTSQSSGTSPGNVGVGGVMTNEDNSDALKSMKGEGKGEPGSRNPTTQARTDDDQESTLKKRD